MSPIEAETLDSLIMQETSVWDERSNRGGSGRPTTQPNSGVVRNSEADLSDKLNDLGGTNLDPDRLAALSNIDVETLPVVEGSVRIGAPVAEVGKIIAIGLNYADHAAETGAELPEEPIVFTKAVTALNGPNDPVILPKGATKGDWEVELAIIIGRKTQYILQAEALSHIAGYAVINDVSERAFQLEGTGQWLKGKSFDTSAPLGPWLVTTDEIIDPQNLNIWLEVNGTRYQDGSTKTMAFGVTHLVSYVSQIMTLLPGDVIATGTPPEMPFFARRPV